MSYHGLFSNGTKYRKKKLFLLWTTVCDLNILLACTTATADTFAFEFDLVMDVMAMFSNTQKCQLERRRIIWEFIKFENMLHEITCSENMTVCGTSNWMNVICITFRLSPFRHRKTTVNHYHAAAGENTTQNQFTQRVNTQHYFVSLIGMFWGYTLAKPCLTAGFNNSRVLCIMSNTIIPLDMSFSGFDIWSLSRPNSLLWQWDSGGVCDLKSQNL